MEDIKSNLKQEAGGISLAAPQKKISFFSAMLIVMGSSIGAGIFFKSKDVLDLSQSSLVLAIFCWIIASISVIAMALALVEISSARNDNLSLLGWIKVFNGRTIFKASKNFMFYIYLPLTYFFMPLYSLLSLQDALGAFINDDASAIQFKTNADWAIWSLIGLGIAVYFVYVSGISSRVGNIHNKIITYIKFVPLAAVAIIGFVLVGLIPKDTIEKISPTVVTPSNDTIAAGKELKTFTPGLGLFIAIGAIFFAFDGFYVAGGIQSEMKEPKKTPLAILLGLGITTLIYLVLAISMSINGGSFYDMLENMRKAFGSVVGRIVFGVINLGIAIGVLGIINGFALWAPRYTEELIKSGELPYSLKYLNRLNDNRPVIGIIYSLVLSVPIYILFAIIGGLGYIPKSSYLDEQGAELYGSGMARLYGFTDLTSTWTSVFVFGFIAMAIYGGLRNRKHQKIQTDQKKYFKISAWIAVVTVAFSMAVTIIFPVIDMFLISQMNRLQPGYQDNVISRILVVFVLFLFGFASFGTTVIEDMVYKHKHGSIDAFENWQKQNFKHS